MAPSFGEGSRGQQRSLISRWLSSHRLISFCVLRGDLRRHRAWQEFRVDSRYDSLMCTLLVASRVWPETPLLVAANRDERLDRASSPPALREFGSRRVFAPLDLVAGGTWMGVNDLGLLVAITNRFQPEGPSNPEGKLSRGLLVQRALSLANARQAVDTISTILASDYNGFHLVMADTSSAWIVWSDGRELSRNELRPGVHVVTERSFAAAPSYREEQLVLEAQRVGESQLPPMTALKESLRAHRAVAMDSTCVHLPELNYGTRSASVVRFDQAGPRSYHYAPGPPCSEAFEDLSQGMLDGFRSGDQSVAR